LAREKRPAYGHTGEKHRDDGYYHHAVLLQPSISSQLLIQEFAVASVHFSVSRNKKKKSCDTLKRRKTNNCITNMMKKDHTTQPSPVGIFTHDGGGAA
jgi:hypothetical protein